MNPLWTMKRALAGTMTTLALTTTLLAVAPFRTATASPVGGAREVIERVLARDTDTFRPVRFRAGEVATVSATGDGDIDLYIYDEDGNLVAKDTDRDGVPTVSWTPRWTGAFTIKVRNCEGWAVAYVLEIK